MGNTGSVCGAVVGAMMAFGLVREKPETMEEMMGSFALPQEFRRRFEAQMGSIICRELTGADLSTQEEVAQYMSSEVPQTVCFPAVGTAYQLVLDLLLESE
jgi:C_GCAxxG_C_C family probable redox protein